MESKDSTETPGPSRPKPFENQQEQEFPIDVKLSDKMTTWKEAFMALLIEYYKMYSVDFMYVRYEVRNSMYVRFLDTKQGSKLVKRDAVDVEFVKFVLYAIDVEFHFAKREYKSMEQKMRTVLHFLFAQETND